MHALLHLDNKGCVNSSEESAKPTFAMEKSFNIFVETTNQKNTIKNNVNIPAV